MNKKTFNNLMMFQPLMNYGHFLVVQKMEGTDFWKLLFRKVSIYLLLNYYQYIDNGGVIFSLQFVCVCVSVCVSGNFCEQNSSRTDAPIWTQFSRNGCFPHWLKPYWIWWPLVKGQGHSDVIPIFLDLRSRSNVTDIEVSAFSECFLFFFFHFS